MSDPKVVAYLLDDGTWVNRFEGEGSERERDAEALIRQSSPEPPPDPSWVEFEVGLFRKKTVKVTFP